MVIAPAPMEEMRVIFVGASLLAHHAALAAAWAVRAERKAVINADRAFSGG